MASKDTYVPSPGDIVTLISGSPDMTVAKFCPAKPASGSTPATEDTVHCVWFDKASDGTSIMRKAELGPCCLVCKTPHSETTKAKE
jgi:uncharacterized protein YodC (DUF2158 family)